MDSGKDILWKVGQLWKRAVRDFQFWGSVIHTAVGTHHLCEAFDHSFCGTSASILNLINKSRRTRSVEVTGCCLRLELEFIRMPVREQGAPCPTIRIKLLGTQMRCSTLLQCTLEALCNAGPFSASHSSARSSQTLQQVANGQPQRCAQEIRA